MASLPAGREYRDIASLTPQANDAFLGVNIAGSTGLENLYFIDGINVTDPKDGSGGLSIPYNFINTMEVRVGGYEAEYSNALG